jgi:hypothetical protein
VDDGGVRTGAGGLTGTVSSAAHPAVKRTNVTDRPSIVIDEDAAIDSVFGSHAARVAVPTAAAGFSS